MGLVLLGALILPLGSPQGLRPSTYLTPALGFALLAAVGTTGYSLIDKQALDIMVSVGYSPTSAGAVFLVLQAIMTVAWGALLVMLLPTERRRLPALWRGGAGQHGIDRGDGDGDLRAGAGCHDADGGGQSRRCDASTVAPSGSSARRSLWTVELM